MEFERSRINAEKRRKLLAHDGVEPYLRIPPASTPKIQEPSLTLKIDQQPAEPERHKEFVRLHTTIKSILSHAVLREDPTLHGVAALAKRIVAAVPHASTEVLDKRSFELLVLGCPVIRALTSFTQTTDASMQRSKQHIAAIHATLLGAVYFHASLISIDPGLARALHVHHNGGRLISQSEKVRLLKFCQEIFRPGTYPFQLLQLTLKDRPTALETALLGGLLAPILHLDRSCREPAPTFKHSWKEDGAFSSLRWLQQRYLSPSRSSKGAQLSWYHNMKMSLRDPPHYLPPSETDIDLCKSIEAQHRELGKFRTYLSHLDEAFVVQRDHSDASLQDLLALNSSGDKEMSNRPQAPLRDEDCRPILLRIMKSSSISDLQQDLRLLSPESCDSVPAIDSLISIIASHSMPAVQACAAAALSKFGIGNQYVTNRIRELLELRTDIQNEVKTELLLSLSAIAAGKKEELCILLKTLGDETVPAYAKAIIEQRLIENAAWNRELLLSEAFTERNGTAARRVLVQGSYQNQSRLVELSGDSALVLVIKQISDAGATTPEVISAIVEKIKRAGPGLNYGAALLTFAECFPAEIVPRETIAQLMLRTVGIYKTPIVEQAAKFIAAHATRDEKVKAASILLASKIDSTQSVDTLINSLASNFESSQQFKSELFQVFEIGKPYASGIERLLTFEAAPRWIKAIGTEMLPMVADWIRVAQDLPAFAPVLKKVALEFGALGQNLGDALLPCDFKTPLSPELRETILYTGISDTHLADKLISKIKHDQTPARDKEYFTRILSVPHNHSEVKIKSSARAIEELRDFVRERKVEGTSHLGRLAHFLQILDQSNSYHALGPVIGGSLMQIWEILDASTAKVVTPSTRQAYASLFSVLAVLAEKDIALASLVRNQIGRERSGPSRDNPGITYQHIVGADKLAELGV